MLNDKLAADAGLLTRDEAARAIVELQHALAAVLVDPSACENLGSPACWAVLLAQLVVSRRPEGWTVEDEDAQRVYSVRQLWSFLNEFKGEKFAHDGRRDAGARSATLVGRGAIAGVAAWLAHGADTSARRANVHQLGDDDSLMLKASMLHSLLQMAEREGLPQEILNLEPPKIRTFTSSAYVARKKLGKAMAERWQQRVQQRLPRRRVPVTGMPKRADVQWQSWQPSTSASEAAREEEEGEVLEDVEAACVAGAAVEGVVSDVVAAESAAACEVAAAETSRPMPALSDVDDEWEEEEEDSEEEQAAPIASGRSTSPLAHPFVRAHSRLSPELACSSPRPLGRAQVCEGIHMCGSSFGYVCSAIVAECGRERVCFPLSLARPRGTCLSSARGISLVLFVFPEPFTDAPIIQPCLASLRVPALLKRRRSRREGLRVLSRLSSRSGPFARRRRERRQRWRRRSAREWSVSKQKRPSELPPCSSRARRPRRLPRRRKQSMSVRSASPQTVCRRLLTPMRGSKLVRRGLVSRRHRESTQRTPRRTHARSKSSFHL